MRAWQEFIALQEKELGVETIEKWIKSLKILRYDACNLYLEAKDTFQAMWFEEHIRPKLHGQFFNNNQKPIKVHLSIASSSAKKASQKFKERPSTEQSFALNFDQLDPNYTFENFIVSSSNELAFKLLQTVSEPSDPSLPQFNPIYLHGSKGSGKTHLLMAAATALRSRGMKVIYSRAQNFTDHVVSAIRAGEMSVFRQAYRNIDVLIVDDIHILSKKGATQEEFFHTFNTLHVAGKQIILSANCPPGELQHIEPRLVSRFEWGIALGLASPRQEEMARILEKKSSILHFPLPQKISQFLLDSFKTTNSLSRALEALILRTHMNRSALPNQSVPIVKQMLTDLLQEEEKSALTPEKIILKVAENYGIRPEDVQGKAQTRDCVLPRQMAMYLCRNSLKLPFTKIGDLFRKDHSTVMSSVKTIQKALDSDEAEIHGAYRTILKNLSE